MNSMKRLILVNQRRCAERILAKKRKTNYAVLASKAEGKLERFINPTKNITKNISNV